MGKPSKDTRTPLPLLRLRRYDGQGAGPSRSGYQRVKPAVVQGQVSGVLQAGRAVSR